MQKPPAPWFALLAISAGNAVICAAAAALPRLKKGNYSFQERFVLREGEKAPGGT